MDRSGTRRRAAPEQGMNEFGFHGIFFDGMLFLWVTSSTPVSHMKEDMNSTLDLARPALVQVELVTTAAVVATTTVVAAV
jgi:hypothetical protein